MHEQFQDANVSSGNSEPAEPYAQTQPISTQLHSKELLEGILDSLGSGVIVTNLEGEFLLFNQTAREILGTGATKTAPSQWAATYGLYSTDRRTPLPEGENPIVRAMKGESADRVEVFVRNPSKPAGVWCSVNVRPLLNSDNKRIGGVVVIDDVTTRKKLAEHLARSNQDLQQFAYVAAHDLQEPLRSIVGFGDLISSRLKDTLDQKSLDQLTRINNAARRMQNLINALLSFARIETRGKPPISFDANEAVAETVDDLHAMIQQNNATINVGELPTIVADKTQIGQLFTNLIANAIKYKSDRPPVIDISCETQHGQHVFAVKDNGIGFNMEYAERIFVIFQRLHDRSKFEGAGVGLSLCKKIVERHGGDIWVESKEAEGSTFFFSLPDSEPAEGHSNDSNS